MQQEAKKVNYALFSVQSVHICMCSSLSDCIHMAMVFFAFFFENQLSALLFYEMEKNLWQDV